MGGSLLVYEVWLTCSSVDTRQISVNQTSQANKKPPISKDVSQTTYCYRAEYDVSLGVDNKGRLHTSAYIARDGKAIVSVYETVGKRGDEKLVKAESAERRTTAAISITDYRRKDVQSGDI
jgi:hypothetical protein